MNRLFLLVSLISIGILSGCLKDNDPNCNSQQPIDIDELLLIEVEGQHYLSLDGTLNTAIVLCEESVPPDSIGFQNIYNISGSLIENCETGGCIKVNEYSNPFCEVAVTISDGNFTLFGGWRIAYLIIDNQKMHPSCLVESENILFSINEDSTIIQALSLFTRNSMLVDFRSKQANTLIITEIDRETSEAPAYIHLFENTVIDLFERTDTVFYTIDKNTMTFEMDQNDQVFLFKEL